MSKRRWKKWEIDWLKKNYNSDPQSAANHLNRTYGSVQSKARNLGLLGARKMGDEFLGVDPEEYDTLEELWDVIDRVKTLYQKLDNENTNPVIDFKHFDHPILLWVLADAHVGSMGGEYSVLKERIELLSTVRHGYGISAGDTTDNFLPSRIPQGMFNQIIPPRLQKQLVEHQYKKLKGHWLAAVQGNHEKRSEDVDDFHFTSYLAKQLGCYNMGYGGLLTLELGKQVYEIAVRHQYRCSSSLNITHTCKRLREREHPNADISIVAHNHQGACEQLHHPDKSRIYIRPGSFKGVDKYSRSIGYNETPHCIPSVILYPDKRKMIPFLNIDDALTVFESII